MSITLTQQRIYKSIRTLPVTTVPDFTLITGLNGSGKSHLLEAISTGQVLTNLSQSPQTEIQLHTWSSLVPNDVGITNISNVHSNRDWFINTIRNRKAERKSALFDMLHGYELDVRFSANPWDSLDLDVSTLGHLTPERRDALRRDLDSFEDELHNFLRNQVRNDDEKMAVFEQIKQEKTPLYRLQTRDFDRRAFSYYGRNIFQHSFGQMFFAYFDKLRSNRSRRMNEIEGRLGDVPSIPEDEFIVRNGPPPWDFVNDMFRRAKLDFNIDHPEDYDSTEYKPRLTKMSTGIEVEFSSLSSGEKVLMSFALCLYNSTDRRQQVLRPKLLLFDEIDAPLHPSMSRTLIDIINEVIVQREGIPVIFVTHSPSTVAVSPEPSIHLLEPDTNLLTAESKRRAVATLSADIPTMSIDFSGRRQVLVESDYDAERYELLYRILSPSIASERSLTFIGVGKDFEGSGSSKVISTVTALTDAGNMSVFGLIDWDLKNIHTARIRVLGSDDRYAIESYLLDPLLVAAAVIEAAPQKAAEVGLTPQDTFASLSELPDAKLQSAIDTVQSAVLGSALSSDRETVTYRDGRTLTVSKAFLTKNGHELEDAVRAAFPALRRWNGTGKLLMHMIDVVIRNHPNLIPARLLDDLEWLCAVEVE